MIPSITPWLSVQDSLKAVEFYTSAFGAEEVYRLTGEDGGLVLRFSVHGAEFWVSGGPGGSTILESSVAIPVRMILTVPDPDAVFDQALKAGATEIFPVGEAYGWRLGRLADPFGFHWEIGYQLGAV